MSLAWITSVLNWRGNLNRHNSHLLWNKRQKKKKLLGGVMVPFENMTNKEGKQHVWNERAAEDTSAAIPQGQPTP